MKNQVKIMLMLLRALNKIIPIYKTELYQNQSCYYIENYLIKKIFKVLKTHFKFYFKVLTLISAIDFPENQNRFKVVYELLSIKYNNRIRIKILVNEFIPIYSIEQIYVCATWWELECWDMFGIVFINKNKIIRLLTDYGFQGFPLRKDFPLSGFIDSRYNITKNRITYENIELAQNYRIFLNNSPWSNLKTK
jgi:NADH:ubiquinone oxidoreductase subunit C